VTEGKALAEDSCTESHMAVPDGRATMGVIGVEYGRP
jgi:hypothetical protein